MSLKDKQQQQNKKIQRKRVGVDKVMSLKHQEREGGKGSPGKPGACPPFPRTP